MAMYVCRLRCTMNASHACMHFGMYAWVRTRPHMHVSVCMYGSRVHACMRV
jgi:hypothetical protein